MSVEKYIRPISLTPIVAKVFESPLLNPIVKDKVNRRQFGVMAGTCTADAVMKMVETWYEATDVPN